MLYDLLKICVSIFFNLFNKVLGGKLPPFGSAAVIVEVNDNYLVVELPRGRIVFPGGFMAWDEQPQQAAEREGKEETGFELQTDDLIGFYSTRSTSWLSMSNLSFVYHARIVGGQLRNSIEGQPRWMSEAELRQRFSQHMLRILDDYLRYREHKHSCSAA
jgi:ADP-ribose pyrophosphatase YjhB (NUDIX family)